MAEEILTDTINLIVPPGQSASFYKIQLLGAICLFFFFLPDLDNGNGEVTECLHLLW